MKVNNPHSELEATLRAMREADEPLNVRLALVADQIRKLDSALADTVDRAVDRLQRAGAGTTAPAVGEPMPNFILPDESGHLVSLDELLKTGPAVVTFHRGNWCPYCRLTAAAVADATREIESFGARIVSIVPELGRFARLFKNDVSAQFPILSDISNGYAMSLNLVIWIGDELRGMLSSGGYDIPLYQGNDSWMVPIPATFVIDRNRLIVARHLDPDYRKRMDIPELLATLRQLR